MYVPSQHHTVQHRLQVQTTSTNTFQPTVRSALHWTTLSSYRTVNRLSTAISAKRDMSVFSLFRSLGIQFSICSFVREGSSSASQVQKTEIRNQDIFLSFLDGSFSFELLFSNHTARAAVDFDHFVEEIRR